MKAKEELQIRLEELRDLTREFESELRKNLLLECNNQLREGIELNLADIDIAFSALFEQLEQVEQ